MDIYHPTCVPDDNAEGECQEDEMPSIDVARGERLDRMGEMMFGITRLAFEIDAGYRQRLRRVVTSSQEDDTNE